MQHQYRYLTLLWFAILLPVLVFCQTPQLPAPEEDIIPCATPPGQSPLLRDFIQNRHQYMPDMDTVYYVPLTVHVVGDDEGNGYYSRFRIYPNLCQLNQDFKESNIQFFLEGDINYINESDFYIHNTVVEGADFMFQYNVENTINCYFVADPAGAGGYNLNYAGITLRNGNMSIGSHTWAHEIGHHFHVQHPFLGWEGGISWDNSMDPNYGLPAPDTVLYNYTFFKDTLILDTLIIDTAVVEKVDGSNCSIAADGFCDTPPDYLAFGWQCDQDGKSTVQQTDPDGNTFFSDGSLIMSYAANNCQDRFSDEQMAFMRVDLLNVRPYLLYNQIPAPEITESLELLGPIQDEIVPPNGVTLQWNEVENASSYYVFVSDIPSFTSPIIETVTTDTSIVITNLTPNRRHYWWVQAYNSHQFCVDPQNDVFITDQASSVYDLPSLRSMQVFPNPVRAQEVVTLQLDMDRTMPLEIQILDMDGRLLQTYTRNVQAGLNTEELEIQDLAAGLYLIGIQGKKGRRYEKLIVY